jgi:hypothetical protein
MQCRRDGSRVRDVLRKGRIAANEFAGMIRHYDVARRSTYVVASLSGATVIACAMQCRRDRMRGFVVVDEALLADDVIADWIARAQMFNRTLPPK